MLAMTNSKDPDELAVVLFRNHAVKNEGESMKQGRPIFDDVEVCEIRFPGSRNWQPFPATGFARWITDPLTGEQVRQSYAERFPRQYQQFKAHATQTKSGTPLTYALFLTEAKRAELRALNVYTLEQLAAIDGQELKNLGTLGRDLKNKAQEYLDDARKGSVNTALAAELEALRARNEVLEEDVKALKDHAESDKANGKPGEFDDMSVEQLREFITTHSGHPPHGALGRKTLVRMAAEYVPKAQAQAG